MRRDIVLAILVLVTACREQNPPAIHRLEIYAPGLKIAINNQGTGVFSRYSLNSENRSGAFSLNNKQFNELIRRLEVYRRSHDTVTGAEFERVYMLAPHCKKYITDNGGITFHWTGPDVDQFYDVDYGCDRDQNAGRNKELRAILRSLPVPEPELLP